MEASVKRNIIIVVSVIIAGIVGFWVLRQLSFGSISITTNDQDGEVSLRQLGGPQKPKKIGKGDTTVRVSPGDYTIEISHDNKVTRGATSVVRGEESSLNLQLQDLKEQDEVAKYTALSLYATNNSLSFLNVPQKLLFQYSLENERADLLSETYPVSQIFHWYNSDEVFFKTSDGTYYLRSGGSDKQIDLTGDPATTEADDLDINNKGELVYVSNQALYYRSSVQASSVMITSLKDTSGSPHIALSDTGLALIAFAPEGSGDNTKVETTTSPAFIINIATKKKNTLPQIISNAHWSPDGKRFIATTDRGLELFNQTGTSLALVSSLLDSGSNTVTWIDNKRFVYADNNIVWLYNTIDGVSTKFSAINGSLARNNPFAVNGKTIYYETDPKPMPGSVGTIHKISF
jgi:hypothetical protein